MCTVSWTAARGGYDLLFNRDELNTRAPELPPAPGVHDGVAALAPRDGDHGGTWLLANEFGLTVALLNDYAAPWRPPAAAPRFSRGHLVFACAAAAGHADVVAAVSRQPLERTPAFHLLALSPAEGAQVLHWDGADLARRVPPPELPLLTSSSFETAAVIARRTWRFGTAVRTPAAPEVRELTAYHRHYDRGEGAPSVLMRRPDASTRSLAHVTVHEGRVDLRYEPVRWALHGPVLLRPTVLSLPLRTPAPAPLSRGPLRCDLE